MRRACRQLWQRPGLGWVEVLAISVVTRPIVYSIRSPAIWGLEPHPAGKSPGNHYSLDVTIWSRYNWVTLRRIAYCIPGETAMTLQALTLHFEHHITIKPTPD